MLRGRKPHLLLFLSTGISSASTAGVLIRSSSSCENFLVTICASSFVTSRLFKHIRTLCGQRRPLKLLVRKRSSGRCTTNYLRTKRRWRIVTSHATPDASVLVGHARASGHPVIASAEPGERWSYCYPD